MNDDEARVRARLHDYADGIEPTRDLPAAGRARYRRLVRRRRATAVLAGALAVIAVTGVGIEVARRPGHTLKVETGGRPSTSASAPAPSTTTAATSGSPGPIVTGEPLADTTWISADEGWALVQTALLHTTDGGKTWRSVSRPPATVLVSPGTDPGVDCTKVACVSHVRFADRQHGWLFGRSFLATSDGGVTWTRDTSEAVLALEVEHGRAYRVVSASDCYPPGCAYFVETAAVGSSAWQRLTTPAVAGDAVQLLYDGPRVYVAVYGNPAGGANARIQLLRSLDAGRTWQVRPDPCPSRSTAEVDTASLAAAPGGFLLALCQPRAGGRAPFVTTSFDAGTSFGSPLSLPLSSAARAGDVAAGAPGSLAVVAFDGLSWVVTVSHDEGRTWHTTLHSALPQGGANVVFLGFEDAHTGRVAFNGDELWTTRDGGESWSSSRP